MRSSKAAANESKFPNTEHADAAVVLGDAMFLSARRQIAASALALRLPTIYNFREHLRTAG
jgi:hypothetical protein